MPLNTRNFADGLMSVVVTLWIGGMWTIGYVVAPTLFATLSDHQLAGLIAGRIFSIGAWLGMVCATYLLIFMLLRLGTTAVKRWVFWLILLMLLFTVASQFGVQPLIAQLKLEALPRDVMDSVLRDRFATWHGIASMLYLIQSILGLLVLLNAERCRG